MCGYRNRAAQYVAVTEEGHLDVEYADGSFTLDLSQWPKIKVLRHKGERPSEVTVSTNGVINVFNYYDHIKIDMDLHPKAKQKIADMAAEKIGEMEKVAARLPSMPRPSAEAERKSIAAAEKAARGGAPLLSPDEMDKPFPLPQLAPAKVLA